MQKKNMDIDKLLDSTKEIADDNFNYMIRHIEIDSLLEKTENW